MGAIVSKKKAAPVGIAEEADATPVATPNAEVTPGAPTAAPTPTSAPSTTPKAAPAAAATTAAAAAAAAAQPAPVAQPPAATQPPAVKAPVAMTIGESAPARKAPPAVMDFSSPAGKGKGTVDELKRPQSSYSSPKAATEKVAFAALDAIDCDADHCLLDQKAVGLLKSSSWDDRKQGLEALQAQITKIRLRDTDNAVNVFCSAVHILQHSINDSVRPVCFAALDCFGTLMRTYSDHFKRFTADTNVVAAISSVSDVLIRRMGAADPKIKDQAQKCVLDVVHKHPKGLSIMWNVVKVAAAKTIMWQHLKVLQVLIDDFGFSKRDGLTLASVMSVAVPALAIADEKTRLAGTDVVVASHAVAGSRISKHLNGVKPAMMKCLNRKFAEHQEMLENEHKQSPSQAVKAKANQANQPNQQRSPSASQADESDDDEQFSFDMPVVDQSVEPEQAQYNSLKLLAVDNAIVLGRNMSSEKWSERKEGIDSLLAFATKQVDPAKKQKNCSTIAEGEAMLAAEVNAYCILLLPGIEQNVVPIVFSACACLRKVLSLYGDILKWGSSHESLGHLHFICASLMNKMHSANKRVQHEVCGCLLALARSGSGLGMRVLVPLLLTSDETGELKSKLNLLRLLVQEFGVQSRQTASSLSVKSTVQIAVTALNEADGKIRKAAVALLFGVEKQAGRPRIMKHLQDVKPATLKMIQEKFAKADEKKEGAKAAANGNNVENENNAPEVVAKGPLKSLAPAMSRTASSGSLKPLGGSKMTLKPSKSKLSMVQGTPAKTYSNPVPTAVANTAANTPVASLTFESDLFNMEDEALMSQMVS
jgi:hypothetical protein